LFFTIACTRRRRAGGINAGRRPAVLQGPDASKNRDGRAGITGSCDRIHEARALPARPGIKEPMMKTIYLTLAAVSAATIAPPLSA
jgi:hypothetical protein